MTPIAAMVLEMITRGVDPEVIALAVSTAEQSLRATASPQKSADESADKRRERDRIRKQTERDNLRKSAESADNPQISNTASIPIESKKESKRQSRGTRIAADWSPSDAERAFAKQEGFSEFEIGREINKFRDHWIAEPGSKGVKLDWPATWRKWIRNSADWAGKAPPSNTNADTSLPDSYYAKPDSEQLFEWDAYSKRTTGKTLARDRNGGWRVKSEWPPGHGTLSLDHPTGAYQEAETR